MIYPEQIKIYIRYAGDVDRFVLCASPEEKEIMKDNDFGKIQSLVQDIILMRRNLSSQEYIQNTRKILADNYIDSETVDLLYKQFKE